MERIVFEQPISERIRAFLRLEYLFARACHEVTRPDLWSSRTTIETIIDVMAVMGRSDLKKEIIHELERHSTRLTNLAQNPNVDQGLLDSVLQQVTHLLSTLKGPEATLGQELRHNELLSAVRQRNSIPAGTCDFDLPAYHFWLKRPADCRQTDLNNWLSAFGVLREAVVLCLKFVRETPGSSQEVASDGFFQCNLDTANPCQMIRVWLPEDSGYYPEISAGRHRFSIRFMQPCGEGRPHQCRDNVPFELACCTFLSSSG